MSKFNNEKASMRQQHHERPERPIGDVTMSQTEIERMRKDLAWSYKCDERLISYKFGRIYNENGTCNTDYADLIYIMKATRAVYDEPVGLIVGPRKMLGTETYDRTIYQIKIILPGEVKEKLINMISKEKVGGNSNTAKEAVKGNDENFLAFS